jgi:hypothetical protein
MRVVFVPLAAIRERAFVASAIAEAFAQANTAIPELAKRLRIACAERPPLLVLVAELLTWLDLEQARARLGPDRWSAEYGAGSKCSIDALLNDIDDVARREALAD